MAKKAAVVTKRVLADENNAVVTVEGGNRYCKRVCPECPWRKANAGSFPPEAFRISANTAKDMATHTFGCHMAGSKNPATCAGFLLSQTANDNLSVRLSRMKGEGTDVEPTEGLWGTYRSMAEANDVPADDEALEGCMPEDRWQE